MLPRTGVRDDEALRTLQQIRDEAARVIVGQTALFDRLLVALLTGTHVLIEGLPGLGKTLAVTTLARCVSATFQRIQFIPDLLPADLVGTMIYNPKSGDFHVRKGPVFANIVLADEINRAPAKVQSALLEAMQERQVTIGDETFHLPDPFLVLATQNPIEQEGTYPLPEAQLDRFIFKLRLDYPDKREEQQILARMATTSAIPEAQAVTDSTAIVRLQRLIDDVYLDDAIAAYIVEISSATRQLGDLVRYGASPRASIFLALGAKGNAFLHGRDYVVPDDVKTIAPDVLRHRVVVSYEAEAQGKSSDDLIAEVLSRVPVP